VSISFISMRPALEMFMTPVIGIVCFAIILLSWFGGVQYYRGMPAGLVAIAIGSLIAWSSSALGFNLRWYESRQPRTLGLELRLLIPTSGRRPRGLWH
jgi:hypothetical protein